MLGAAWVIFDHAFCAALADEVRSEDGRDLPLIQFLAPVEPLDQTRNRCLGLNGVMLSDEGVEEMLPRERLIDFCVTLAFVEFRKVDDAKIARRAGRAKYLEHDCVGVSHGNPQA